MCIKIYIYIHIFGGKCDLTPGHVESDFFSPLPPTEADVAHAQRLLKWGKLMKL